MCVCVGFKQKEIETYFSSTEACRERGRRRRQQTVKIHVKVLVRALIYKEVGNVEKMEEIVCRHACVGIDFHIQRG